jgi:hypothetical protein
VAVAGDQPHTPAVALHNQAVAVVLDFVDLRSGTFAALWEYRA